MALSSNWANLKTKINGSEKAAAKKSNTGSKVTKIPRTKKLNKKKNETIITPEENAQETPETVEDAPKITQDAPKSSIHLQLSSLTEGSSARQKETGKYLAMDCEFVGVGPEGKESALARVSLVNFYGHLVFDSFVKPKERVVDWRTWVSGVTPQHMKSAITFKEAQDKTAELLKDRILVGHAVHHDLDSLFLSHPKSLIRDTSLHLPFRQLAMGKTPGLKKLAKEVLNIEIQGGEHSSVEDARATMLLYRLHKPAFEKNIRKFSSPTKRE